MIESENSGLSKIFFTFYLTVIPNIITQCTAVRNMNEMFNFLWKYLKLFTKELADRSNKFTKFYCSNVSGDLMEEISHMKLIQPVNFKKNFLPLKFLNTLEKQKSICFFPNVVFCLRLFCTFPVTIVKAEMSFRKLARMKDFFISTMAQYRLSSMRILDIKYILARQLNCYGIFDLFENKKAKQLFFKNVKIKLCNYYFLPYYVC